MYFKLYKNLNIFLKERNKCLRRVATLIVHLLKKQYKRIRAGCIQTLEKTSTFQLSFLFNIWLEIQHKLLQPQR